MPCRTPNFHAWAFGDISLATHEFYGNWGSMVLGALPPGVWSVRPRPPGVWARLAQFPQNTHRGLPRICLPSILCQYVSVCVCVCVCGCVCRRSCVYPSPNPSPITPCVCVCVCVLCMVCVSMCLRNAPVRRLLPSPRVACAQVWV